MNPNFLQKFELRVLAGTRMGVDIAVLTYKYKSDYITKTCDKLNLFYEEINALGATEHMIKEVLRFMYNVLKTKIVPVTVFDGTAPALKDRTKEKRIGKSVNTKAKIDRLRNIGKTLTETPDHQFNEDDLLFLADGFKKSVTTVGDLVARMTTEVKSYIVIEPWERKLIGDILTILGLPNIQAPSEAEYCCAEMCRNKDVASVFTTDSDALMYGCPIMINAIKPQTSMIVGKPVLAEGYTFKNALEITNLHHGQFFDFCILNGTDFNDNSDGLGPDKNHWLIKTYKSMDNIVREHRKLKALIDSHKVAEADLTTEQKILLKVDPEVYNYTEILEFAMTPTNYDKRALNISIRENHRETTYEALKNLCSESLLTKISPYVDKILDLLVPVPLPPEIKTRQKKK